MEFTGYISTKSMDGLHKTPFSKNMVYEILAQIDCPLCKPLLKDIKASDRAEDGLRYLAEEINPLHNVLVSLTRHEKSGRPTQTDVFWLMVSHITDDEEARLKANFKPVLTRNSLDTVFWTYGINTARTLYILAAVRNTIESDKHVDFALMRSALLTTILIGDGRVPISREDNMRVNINVFVKRPNLGVTLNVLLSHICFLNLDNQAGKHIVADDNFHILANLADVQFNCFAKAFWDMFIVTPKGEGAAQTLMKSFNPDTKPQNFRAFTQTRGIYRTCAEEVNGYLASFTLPDISEGGVLEVPAMLFSVTIHLGAERKVMDEVWAKFQKSLETLSYIMHDVALIGLEYRVVQCVMAMVAPTKPTLLATILENYTRKFNADTVRELKRDHGILNECRALQIITFTPFPPCGRSVLMECLRARKNVNLKEKFKTWNNKQVGGGSKLGYVHMLASRSKVNPKKSVLYFLTEDHSRSNIASVASGAAQAGSSIGGVVVAGAAGKAPSAGILIPGPVVAGAVGKAPSAGILIPGPVVRPTAPHLPPAAKLSAAGKGKQPARMSVSGAVEPLVGIPLAQGPPPAKRQRVDLGNAGEGEVVVVDDNGGAAGGAGGVVVDLTADQWAGAKLDVKKKFLFEVNQALLASEGASVMIKAFRDSVVNDDAEYATNVEIETACARLRASYESLQQAKTIGIAVEVLRKIQ